MTASGFDGSKPREQIADQSEEQPLEPVQWRALTADEAGEQWDALFEWVQTLRSRYPNSTRLPDCWWQHNDVVEAMSALRDLERAAFGPGASLTGPVQWQRALLEVEQRIEMWVRRFACSVPGRGHDQVRPALTRPSGWDEAVARDIAARQSREAPSDPR